MLSDVVAHFVGDGRVVRSFASLQNVTLTHKSGLIGCTLVPTPSLIGGTWAHVGRVVQFSTFTINCIYEGLHYVR